MNVLGLMSGTSVDGIDVVLAEIVDTPALRVEQRFFTTVPWQESLRAALFALFAGPTSTAALCEANVQVAEAFAQAALTALAEAGIAPSQVDLIGSHGQTVWHEVQAGQVRGTLQIGAPSIIATRTGITTVGNFRVADVAVGGQGAPLVSTYDWYLLRPPPQLNGIAGGWRAVQNIGGIANVTFLSPSDQDAAPLAFDTGPGNALIDWAAGVATQGRLSYDVDGQLAAAGRIDEELLTDWLAHPYFAEPPPKSTGRERFTFTLGEGWLAAATARGLPVVDFVATITALTAVSIAEAYARFAPGPLAQVVVGGGGARNPVLMAHLARELHSHYGRSVEVCSHEALGINADAKEALAFALLAYLTIHGAAGNVPACTGANRQVVLGEIAPGANYGALIRKLFR